MPDIFTDNNPVINTKGSDVLKPVREATPLLIGKIIFALLLPMLLYALALFSALEIRHLFSFDQDWSIEFFLFLLVITLIQIALITIVTLQWKTHEYYFTDTYIQENKGILTKTDKMYDLKNVRSVSVRQGILGRLLNYGDIIVESTAPEFHEVIIISGISNPDDHEAFLRTYV